MIYSIKVAASALAGGMALIAYIPYLVDMFKGKNRPHLYTWISMFLVTAVVGYMQLAGGAGVGTIPTFLGAAVDGVILFYCFRFGSKDIVLMDKFCLAASVGGIITYVALHRAPMAALAIMTGAEFVSFVPTFRKTRNDPYSESLPSYYLLVLKFGLILVAIQKYTLITASYPALWGVVCMLFLAAAHRWRARAAEPSQTPAFEVEPLV